MMTILFLDDDSSRTKAIKEMIPSIITTETAKGMIELIGKHPLIDVLYLDHDLGGEVFVDSNREDCGMEVVRWIVINKPVIREIIVHTCNYSASIEMTKKLAENGYEVKDIPFHYLVGTYE